MKIKKRLAISVMINLALILLLIVAIGEAQRNRKLYIEQEQRNALLISEINDRNNTIADLRDELKKFGVEYTY